MAKDNRPSYFGVRAQMHDEKWLKQVSQAAIKIAEDRLYRDVLAKQLITLLVPTLLDQPKKAEITAPDAYA